MPDISKVIHLGTSGVSKPDKASVFMELKGKEISASPHIGVKAEPENVTLIGSGRRVR